MIELYKIDGAVDLNQDHPCYDDPNTFPEFQQRLDQFKTTLLDLVKDNKAASFIRYGDGEYYFLKKHPCGSARPGHRALSKQYNDATFKHDEFLKGVHQNDYVLLDLTPVQHDRFSEIYPSLSVDFPLEYIYGLVSNKWITSTFKGKVGLIGASPKIKLIKKLMEHEEYQNYLGLDKFEDYIEIPQRFACDDIDATEELVAAQLKESKSDIFLFGMGQTKMGLAHKLKNHKNAVYLDVGSSIDALAGIIDHLRPYFGNWQNYRVKDYDYSKLDLLQVDIWRTPHKFL